MSEFTFETFDKRNGRLVKTPELTIQARGSISMNAAAYRLLDDPAAVELLYDRERRVMGIRKVEPEAAHAYPIRGVGKGGSGTTFVMSARAFFAYYNIPLGTPTRRDVRLADDVLIVDLNDPGRIAVSNRNLAKRVAESNGAAHNGAEHAEALTDTPGSRPLPG